eukprot:31646_1
MTAQRSCERSCIKIISNGYDIFSPLIFVLDVLTDLIVMARFYEQDRMGFFYASLSIIIVTNFIYCIALVIASEHLYWSSTCHSVCIFMSNTFDEFDHKEAR